MNISSIILIIVTCNILNKAIRKESIQKRILQNFSFFVYRDVTEDYLQKCTQMCNSATGSTMHLVPRNIYFHKDLLLYNFEK